MPYFRLPSTFGSAMSCQISEVSDIDQSNLDDKALDDLPNNIFFSRKRFEYLYLSSNLVKGAYSMGFQAPTEVQSLVMPIIQAIPLQDSMIQSSSDSGKTAAFLLTSINQVNSSLSLPQVVILSPTYELAVQTGQVAEKLAAYCKDIKFAYAIKGIDVMYGDRIEAQMIIATPEKLFAWASECRIDLTTISIFVVDEADVIMNVEPLYCQFVSLYNMLTEDCQKLFFSSTYSVEARNKIRHIVRDPISIRLQREEILDNIKQHYIECVNFEEKLDILCQLFPIIFRSQSIIFCQSEDRAFELDELLKEEGFWCELLCTNLPVSKRLFFMENYKKRNVRIIVTTSHCLRGIDLENVRYVINVDLPTNINDSFDYEMYRYWISRTGRFGKEGFVINIVDAPGQLHVLGELKSHYNVEKIEKEDIKLGMLGWFLEYDNFLAIE